MLADLNRFRYCIPRAALAIAPFLAVKSPSSSRSEFEMAPDTETLAVIFRQSWRLSGAGLTDERHDQPEGLCRGTLDRF